MTLPVRQIAYFVADIRAAAQAHHKTFGSGPFFILDHIPLVRSEHRGVARLLDHSSAYGQWGQVMVEFVQQHNADPSAYHDLYPQGSGRFGLFRTGRFGFRGEKAVIARELDIAAESEVAGGERRSTVVEVSGHVVEHRVAGDEEQAGRAGEFYAHVAAAAAGWDGQDPLRTLNSR